MLPNIRQHSIMVARVAEVLVDGLPNPFSGSSRKAREFRQVVIAGALLHDIAKTQCLDNSCDHAKLGAEICRQLGYRKIAPLVEEHVILKQHEPSRHAQGLFTAREIVYYADKRVRHHTIVSLAKRLDYIITHYGRNDHRLEKLIRDNFNKCLALEQHLFNFLDFSADQLADRVCRACSALPTSAPGTTEEDTPIP